MENNTNLCFFKLLYVIYDSTHNGVHNIIIYNTVSHNFKYIFRFLDITHFVGINE